MEELIRGYLQSVEMLGAKEAAEQFQRLIDAKIKERENAQSN